MKHPSARFVTLSQGILCAAALLGLGSLALAQEPPTAAGAAAAAPAQSPAQVKSEGSYSLGLSMGESLRRASVTTHEISTARVMQGLQDALSGKASFGTANEQSIRTLIVGARAHASSVNHAAARAFLARNRKKTGVVTTKSGLQYLVLKPGRGAAPQSGDTVTVNYSGKLLDGTVFDSSYKRGQPATFPVDRVIPGWQEALKLMKPGAKWRIFVPPQLAYDLNSPPPIPPGSLLVFDVDLLSVQPPQPKPEIQHSQPGQPQP